MALDISSDPLFAGRFTAPSTDYPYGSAKNETGAGNNDGTPYIKKRADDIFGFQQALLTKAGIVPSGNADTVNESQYLQALLLLTSAIGPKRGVHHLTDAGGDPDHDIRIKPGFIVDSTGTELIEITSDIIKQIDAALTTGSGTGGFPSSLVLAPGWYGFFILKDPTTGNITAGWDTDDAIANILIDLPAYTVYQRIGLTLVDAGNVIRHYIYDPNTGYNRYLERIEDYQANVGAVASTISLASAAPGRTNRMTVGARYDDAGNGILGILLSELAALDQAPAGITSGVYTAVVAIQAIGQDERAVIETETVADSSGQFRIRASSALDNQTSITGLGFYDDLKLGILG